MKKQVCFWLILALLAGALAGCQRKPAEYVPTGDGLSWGEDTQPATQATEEDEEKIPVVMAYYPQLPLHPYQSVEALNRMMLPLVYQSLFIISPDYQPEPQLCSTFRVSEDLTAYTFYIMKEACFSDGDPVLPSDVVASLQAAMKEGYYASRFPHVKSVSESIDRGVTVELDCSYESLPLLLDVPILKKEQINAPRPLGSGPYMFQERGKKLMLMRNPAFWGGSNPPIDAPSIPLRETDGTAGVRDLFEFSDVSLVCTDPGSDSYAQYRCDYELWDVESGIFVYLGCNTKEGVFSDDKIRAVLPYAVDRERLAADFYRGFAQTTTLPVSPASPNYHPGLAAKYQYQGGKFAQAVMQAGLKGTEIRFLANSDDTLRLRVARSIGKMLEESGLKVKMEEKNQQDYINALRERAYDLYLGQTRLSPNMDLSHFFYEDGKLSFGPMDDETMYALCLQALENSGNFYDLHQTVLNDGRLCPILFRSYAVYAKWGTNWDLYPARDNIFYAPTGRTMEEAIQHHQPEVPTEPVTVPQSESQPETSESPEQPSETAPPVSETAGQ